MVKNKNDTNDKKPESEKNSVDTTEEKTNEPGAQIKPADTKQVKPADTVQVTPKL